MPRKTRTPKVEEAPKKNKRFSIKKIPANAARHHRWLNCEYLASKFPANFRILGLDLAKYKTGYTVIDCETHGDEIESHLETYGLIECGTTLTVSKAITFFYDEVITLIEKFKPDIIAYEYVAVATNLSAFKSLAKSEAAMQIAVNKVFPENPPLIIPITVRALKKLALQGKAPNTEKAKELYAALGYKRSLTDQLLGKLTIMHATEETFGVRFTDDNECDSFLAATGAVYLARYLYRLQTDGELEQFIDKPNQINWSKLKWAKDQDRIGFEIAQAVTSSPTIVRENDLNESTKISHTIRDLYHVVPVEADPDLSGAGDDSDDSV